MKDYTDGVPTDEILRKYDVKYSTLTSWTTLYMVTRPKWFVSKINKETAKRRIVDKTVQAKDVRAELIAKIDRALARENAFSGLPISLDEALFIKEVLARPS